jgi:hypothetical protein
VLLGAAGLVLFLAALAHAGDMPAIDQPDPLHNTPPTLPPPELGLPPNPEQAPADAGIYPVPRPPMSSSAYWPCTSCHNDPKDIKRERRVLKDDHTDIVLNHGENRWCYDCHTAENRDQLHLVDGTLIPFEESYRLCGQCHGPQYKDWKVGVHGKRTGMWNGEKQYLLCVSCHNQHSPHFKPLKPEAPPVRPDDIR